MQKLIVANWKSNKDVTQSQHWCQEFFPQLPELSPDLHITIAVPYPLLSLMNDYLTASKIDSHQFSLAVQDVSPYPAGSYTGAVSVNNLAGLGVKYALVGHSERRKYFAETNQTVARKCELLLDAKITPVVCVEASNIQDQAAVIDADLRPKLAVAFDPMSAISTHSSNGAKKIGEVGPVLSQVKTHFGEIPAIYGGSVDENNVAQYMLIADGVLPGRASLDPHQFLQLVSNAWVKSQD